MPDEIKFVGHEPETIRMIKHKILDRDENFLGIFTGRTGIGKSGAAIKTATMIKPDFDLSHLVFSAKDFMELMGRKDLKKGDVIIWDEIGVGQVGGYGSGGLASREFMSTTNRILNYFMQGFRVYNLCVLFTLPSLSMLDVQTRNLAHGVWVCLARDDEHITAKFYQIDHNPVHGKTYQKFLVSDNKKVKRTFIERPPTIIWHQYLKKKATWLEQLRSDVTAKLDVEIKEKKKKEVFDARKVLAEMMEKYPGRKITESLVEVEYPEIPQNKAATVATAYRLLQSKAIIPVKSHNTCQKP